MANHSKPSSNIWSCPRVKTYKRGHHFPMKKQGTLPKTSIYPYLSLENQWLVQMTFSFGAQHIFKGYANANHPGMVSSIINPFKNLAESWPPISPATNSLVSMCHNLETTKDATMPSRKNGNQKRETGPGKRWCFFLTWYIGIQQSFQ